MQRFPLAVDHARLHQINHAVGAHLGVDAQVALVGEAVQHRLRDAADAGLQRGSVGNQRGHVACHAHMQLGARLRFQLQQRAVRLHNGGNVVHVHGGLAVRARHLPVHFGNHDPRVANRRERAVYGRAQAHKPMRIRRRHLHQHHVKRQSARLEEAFNLAQKDRSVVSAPIAHCLTHVVAQEQSPMAEVPLELGARVVGRAQRLHVDDFDVAQRGGAAHQSVNQNRRRAATRLDPDTSAGSYNFQRLRRTHALALVILAPGHLEPPPHIPERTCIGSDRSITGGASGLAPKNLQTGVILRFS